MNKKMSTQTTIIETSGRQRLNSESVTEDARAHLGQEPVTEPSIPLLIALILGTMWLGILLAIHWPF